ncbi:MAG: PHP domain-containing protein [Candidatus Woesebacteria bacterium]
MSKTVDYTNAQIAKLLTNVGAVYMVNGENSFAIRAYQNAASSIENYPTQIHDLWKEQKLDDVPGLGKTLRGYLDELFTTGKVDHFEKTLATVPAGMFALMDIPGIGPKNALKLAVFFKLTTEKTAIKDLASHAQKGEIGEIEGFTPVGEKRIIEAIKTMRDKPDARLPLPDALAVAADVISYLSKNTKVKRVEALGSLRRHSPTTGDIDIGVATDDASGLFDHIKQFSHQKRIVGTGPKSMTFIHSSGWQVDVKTVHPEAWGSMLQHFTGSKMHNVHLRTLAQKHGLSINEFGIEKNGKRETFATEEEFYSYLKMQWVPPELREDAGEIEAALKNKLPHLLELADIRGDVHIHTNYDFPTSHDLGQSTMDDLLLKAKELEYSFIGFADHNPKRGNLSPKERLQIVKDRNQEIEETVARFFKGKKPSLTVYKGMEVDILPDGSLALEDEALAELDYVIASVHSAFIQDQATTTKRLIKVIEHPLVKIIGHPTGQLIQERRGIDADWEEVFAAAKHEGKIMEINAAPSRTDLPSNLIKRAVDLEIPLIIDTDAHHVSQMHLMPYGVFNARRGWATKANIINTHSTLW